MVKSLICVGRNFLQVKYGYYYSIFILYLSYIYSIFIVYLQYVVGKQRVGFFVKLVERNVCSPPMGTRDEVVICPQVPSRWSVTQRLFMICPLRGHYILNCVKRNMISVAPTALFYLWGSFIRGLHPCLCYFVPPGLCFNKISMNYQEYTSLCLFISFLWDFVL